jgi:7-cyano-7-deazaguanine synthase
MSTEFIDLPKPTAGAFDPLKYHDSCAIVSGGMDSVTLVYDMVSRGMKPHLLSFNYGQRHKKELAFAHIAAKTFGLRHDIIDLSSLTGLISNSALTSDVARHTKPMAAQEWSAGKEAGWVSTPHIEVPEGHYAADNMALTVVPNRNMMMLSIAGAVAVNYGYSQIGTGVHTGDHYQYPDCRPDFVYAVGRTLKKGNEGFHKFFLDEDLRDELRSTKKVLGQDIQGDEGILPILAPYLEASKQDIAVRGFELGVPWHLTWSCYKGETNHCGRCGTCVERLEAIAGAQKVMVERYPATANVWADYTVYDDSEYWKVVTK